MSLASAMLTSSSGILGCVTWTAWTAEEVSKLSIALSVVASAPLTGAGVMAFGLKPVLRTAMVALDGGSKESR